MILQSLHDLYDRLADDPSYGIAPLGYSPQKIAFTVILKPDGTLFAIQDSRLKDDKGNLHAEAKLVLGKAKPSGSGLNPGLLWDNTTYMLGYKPEDPKPERTAKSFKAFQERHLTLEKEINCPAFSTVCRFLESWSPEIAAAYAIEHPILNELVTGFGLFQIQGEVKPVNQQSKILTWWDSQATATSETGQCLITGETLPIARLHPKIKSVAGAQAAGASLVSFNAPAYESYRKDQSFNAPVSELAAFKYSTALNSLLSGPKSKKHRFRIGDTTCVFWTDQPSSVEEALPFYFSDGSNAQDDLLNTKIEIFFKALRSGTEVLEELGEAPTQTRFYILGLAPNAARLAIRFFHQSNITELLNNLRAHHADISIVREYDKPIGKKPADPEFPPNWQLLTQSARVSDEIPPLLAGSLMRAILQNTIYPIALYTAVLRRIRADRTINYYRAAIIKGTLIRNHNQQIPDMLDTENKQPAYLLGRLFATLEKTQYDALGDLNSGIRDKFYSSASATPASVFPRILRTYQHHLAKLSGGHKVNRERLVQDIMGDITSFPSHLNLQAQGLFAIGYYHQRKDFFNKKETSQPSS
jgi:CRISPR-associated protein Csd1